MSPQSPKKILSKKYKSKVAKGAGRGKKLGFPTANLDFSGLNLDFKTGIYAVWVWIEGQKFGGVMHYGPRDTFQDKKNSLEIYIFDFNQDIYGKKIEFELVKFLRPTLKFEKIEDLISQIKKDCQAALKILNKPDLSSLDP